MHLAIDVNSKVSKKDLWKNVHFISEKLPSRTSSFKELRRTWNLAQIFLIV
jgi:hypothetical protein